MSSTLDLLGALEDAGKQDERKYPEGISDHNSSGKAYIAMLEVAKEKRRYIKSHSKKTDYRSEKAYLVQRSEISKQTGVAVQSLFNTSTYAKALVAELQKVNDELKELKEKRFSEKTTRTKAKSKDSIYSENMALKSQIELMKKQLAEEHINAVIGKMSLKAKKILLP
ncbi:hypothetical protein FJ444_20850 [Aestuariibacter sp. GS-14]|uniref:hypothetical protein n=1 Tax=Aestuariibacter sp. GS-14 TaxID=2590670 RepID=UPI0011262F70|nr:hypothetical protein [Aestuariibacter sp. GS-14]TPV52901.1 hypothetical protein FJ444_20850 [Aestuariibacter sp. GS-14]